MSHSAITNSGRRARIPAAKNACPERPVSLFSSQPDAPLVAVRELDAGGLEGGADGGRLVEELVYL